MSKGLVYGIGINDADYVVSPTIDGKVVRCKIYKAWTNMLERCYTSTPKNKSYLGCTVANEWHSFMVFRAWVLTQDFKDKVLDKDLLILNNRQYSKETCIFISQDLSRFLVDSSIDNGLPSGVSVNRDKFIAFCRDSFTKTRKNLGRFPTPEEAHLAWKAYKHKLALQYAELETDPRIIKALQTRYLTETL